MFKDLYYEIKYYFGVLAYPTVCLLLTIMPATCYVIGTFNTKANKIEIAIAIVLIQFILYMTKKTLTKRGEGNDVPVPARRFTYVSDDGEVSIDTARLQELLLYVGDLEDYLERKGKL